MYFILEVREKGHLFAHVFQSASEMENMVTILEKDEPTQTQVQRLGPYEIIEFA